MEVTTLVFLSFFCQSLCITLPEDKNEKDLCDRVSRERDQVDINSSMGVNLLDSDVSVVEDELGCSLASGQFFSDMSLAGSSIVVSDADSFEVLDSDTDIDCRRQQMITSTPFKKKHLDLMDSDISTIDDELGSSLRSEVGESGSEQDFGEISNIADVSYIPELLNMELDNTDNVQINMENLPVPDTDRTTEFMDLDQFSTVLAVPYVSKNKDSLSRSHCLEKVLNEASIVRSITQSCNCPKRCTEKIDYNTAFNMRRNFWSKPREIRSEQLVSQLSYAQKNGKYTYVFLENGDGICIKGYQLVFNLNKNFVTKHKRLADANGNSLIHYRIRQTDSRIINCINWLENHASTYGDKMPNTNDVLLPYRTVKKNVYISYKLDTTNPVSESAFYGVWKKHFPHLKIKKTNSFTQCTKCAFLLAKIDNTPSLEGKKTLRIERGYHIQRQMLERKYYYGKKLQSQQQPEEFLSLIIDGMDQSKTDLPHFTGRRAKVINPSDLMGTHITGVLSHGHNLFLNYVDLLEYPHDPNLTINVLLKTLVKIATMKGSLPPVLYLQADNCRRENKNKYVLAFLELLVRQKIFREIHFSFLYVGHTHEDIDAAFSKISRKLKKKNADTLTDLLQFIPNVERISHLLDVKSWMSDSLCVVSGTSVPLHYKFVSHGNSVKVFYKGQQHTLWQAFNGRGTFLRTIPGGKPKIIKPDYDKFNINLEKLKKLISSVQHMFSSEQKFQWWNTFLPKIKTFGITENCHHDWINVLPKQPLLQKHKKNLHIHIDQDLRKMLDKESAEPELTCEKKSVKTTKSKHKQNGNKSMGRAGKGVRVLTNRKQQTKKAGTAKKKQTQQKGYKRCKESGESKHKQTKRRRHLSCTRQVIIPVDEDVKKHIWILIFLYLVETFISFSSLLMYIFYLLCFVTAVSDIVIEANILWNKLLTQHIGAQFAKVSVTGMLIRV